MIDQKVLEGLRTQFHHMHPLMFARSVERAGSPGELFDILSTCPTGCPVVWVATQQRWVKTDDLLQSKEFEMEP